MLHSNTQGARTLRATIGLDQGVRKTAKSSAFSASAIKKMGFDPFTGQQVLAPPTSIKEKDIEKPKLLPVATSKENMIELEFDDDD